MEIDYTKVIRNCVGPKLAYHGFKYNEEKSHPPTGQYEFTRTYWGKLQHVSISRIQYNLEEERYLTGEGDDIPTEVPPKLMLIQEPDYRLWLSNRYISVLVGHEGGAIEVTRRGIADYTIFKHLANMPDDEAKPALRELRRKHLWWEFRNEVGLRTVLRDILEMVLTEGLEWFEHQVAESRRYYEKLDARRKAEKEKRQSKKLKKAQRTASEASEHEDTKIKK